MLMYYHLKFGHLYGWDVLFFPNYFSILQNLLGVKKIWRANWLGWAMVQNCIQCWKHYWFIDSGWFLLLFVILFIQFDDNKCKCYVEGMRVVNIVFSSSLNQVILPRRFCKGLIILWKFFFTYRNGYPLPLMKICIYHHLICLSLLTYRSSTWTCKRRFDWIVNYVIFNFYVSLFLMQLTFKAGQIPSSGAKVILCIIMVQAWYTVLYT